MAGAYVKRLRDPVTGRFASTGWTRFTHRFKGGEVEVKLNTAAVRAFGANQLRGLIQGVAERGAEGARLRTRPGVGPGPHPHRTDHGWEWEDTGNLAAAIRWAWEELQGRDQVIALVGVDAEVAPYGHWLELGFHGPSGRFYRYPFLAPAMEVAMRDWQRYVRLAKLPAVIPG